MRTGARNRDKGYSLIELIVVIAIMAVVVGLVGMSVTLITGRKVKKCGEEITSTLERAKVLALGKTQGQVEFVLREASNGDIYAEIYQGSTTEPVNSRLVAESGVLNIRATFSDSSVANLGSISGNGSYAQDSSGLHLVFNRSTGAFEKNTSKVGDVEKEYCTDITISNSRRTVKITLVGATGKIVTEY